MAQHRSRELTTDAPVHATGCLCCRFGHLSRRRLMEHQLGWLTSMPRATRREKIDETVRIAVKVFLRGCAARG